MVIGAPARDDGVSHFSVTHACEPSSVTKAPGSEPGPGMLLLGQSLLKPVSGKMALTNHDDKQHRFLVLKHEMDVTSNLRRIHPILDKRESTPPPVQHCALPIDFPSLVRAHVTLHLLLPLIFQFLIPKSSPVGGG